MSAICAPDSSDAPNLTDEEKELVAVIVREKPWRGLIYYTSYPFQNFNASILTIILVLIYNKAILSSFIFIIIALTFDIFYYKITERAHYSDYEFVRKIVSGQKFKKNDDVYRTIGNWKYNVYLTIIFVILLTTSIYYKDLENSKIHFYVSWITCVSAAYWSPTQFHSKDFPEDFRVAFGENLKSDREAYSAIYSGFPFVGLVLYLIMIFVFVLDILILNILVDSKLDINGIYLFYCMIILIFCVNLFSFANFNCKTHFVVKKIHQETKGV